MSKQDTKRVAVIGAGISGVVAAAHLRKEGIEVTVFERSKASGGVWLYDQRKPLEPPYPSLIASQPEKYYEAGVEKSSVEDLLHAPPGPCYFGLRNNVSTRLLRTTLHPFPPETPDYVSHEVLCRYIQETAVWTGVDALTQYNTEVKSLQKDGSTWHVEALTLHAEPTGSVRRERTIQDFDSVIVASGHYHAAKVPDIPGLANWKGRWPHRVQHSKGYRRPEEFKGKNFLLIGGSVSSTDIARELGPIAQNIYQSHRNGLFDLPASLLPENAIRVDEIASFDDITEKASNQALADIEAIPATVTLKSGRKLCDIHHVLLCTGYHVTVPFLPQLHSDTTSPEQADDTILVTDGTQLHNLHKDIFYIPDPSLIFIGVPFFTATFTLFEFQAMVIAKVLKGEVELPSGEEMRAEYQRRVQVKGYGKKFHSLREKEVEYVDELLEWVNHDLLKADKERLLGHTDEWKIAKEEQVARMKAMFTTNPGPDRQIEIVCW